MNKLNQLKSNKTFISEITIIFCIWLLSVWISSPNFNRFIDWDNAHILVSMRAFEQWGFWKLLGVSTWLQSSYEWAGVDITTQKIEIDSTYLNFYLSAPSWYIVFPYLTWKLLNLTPFTNVNLDPQFLELYNLVFSRLIGSIFVYYLYLQIIQTIVKNSWKNYHKKALAFLGLIGWIFIPKMLYYTQNSCFGGRAYIGFLYAIFLISIKCSFKFENLSRINKLYLLVLSFIVCATDYFGWFSIFVISLIVLFDKLFFSCDFPKVSFNFLLNYLNTIKLLISGVILSGTSFLVQLLYYKNGINYLINRFLQRSGLVDLVDDQGNIVNNLQVVRKIVYHWISFSPIFKSSFYSLLNKSITENIKDFFLIACFIILCLLFIFSLFYFLIKNDESQQLFYLYIILFLVPIAYIFLLKQVSYVHGFSGFPMALPIVFSLLILPTLLIGTIFANNKVRIFFIFAMMSLTLVSNRVLFLNSNLFLFSNLPTRNINKDIGNLIKENIKFDELPLTRTRPLSVPPLVQEGLMVQPLPPQALWYTKRYIYDLPTIQKLIKYNKLNITNVEKMNPVFIAYKKNKDQIDDEVRLICNEKWIEIEPKLTTNRQVIACKTDELRQLYLSNSNLNKN